MKKFLVILLLLPTLSLAQHYHHHNHHQPHWRYSGGNWNWMVPALIGGIVVYETSKQPAPQPIIIQQQPQENCTPWTEIQTPDGKIYRERTCQK